MPHASVLDRAGGDLGGGDLGAASRPSDRVQRSGVSAVRILGIVAKTHDSGLALLKDGVPEFVLEEERYNRIKKTNKFPKHSLRAAFAELNLGIGDIDVITTPWDVRQLRRTCLSIVGAPLPAQPVASCCRSSHVVPAEPDRAAQSAICEKGLREHFGRRHAAPDRQCRPSRLARRHVLRLALRGGAGAGHGRLRRRQLEQRLSRPRQPPGAALVDRRHELGRARLHVRHRAPGLCRLRRRGQGDGARRLRRGHLRQALPRRHQARRPTAAMPSTWTISATTPSASCGPSSASSSTRSAPPARPTSRSPTGTATSPSPCRP